MNIDDLTGQEKSMLLADIRGWGVNIYRTYFKAPNQTHIGRWLATLYDPALVDLALNFHFWALNQAENIAAPYVRFWKAENPWLYEEAPYLWLDKILSLCIEAEKIELKATRSE